MAPTLETRFSPLTQVQRTRLLPEPGRVLVQPGDWVHPDDVIATAPRQAPLRVIDVAQLLGISPAQAARAIAVHEGETLSKTTALAQTGRGPWRRQHPSPIAGTVQSVVGPRVFVRQAQRALQLKAYIPGIVVETIPQRGATIRTNGALVRAIWGAGGAAHGVLATMVEYGHQELTWGRIGLRYRGTIIVGGILRDPRVIHRAGQFQISALVVGSISPEMRQLCARAPLPVLVTEGVGEIPMAEPVFNLLRACHGHAAVANAQGCDSELIVPLSGPQVEITHEHAELQPGMRVRLTRPPYLGLLAEVIRTSEHPEATAIGSQAKGALVRLADGRKLFVPLLNLEAIE